MWLGHYFPSSLGQYHLYICKAVHDSRITIIPFILSIGWFKHLHGLCERFYQYFIGKSRKHHSLPMSLSQPTTLVLPSVLMTQAVDEDTEAEYFPPSCATVSLMSLIVMLSLPTDVTSTFNSGFLSPRTGARLN